MKLFFCSALCTAIIGHIYLKKSSNNVCKTFEDYYTDRDQNKNCYHNPDAELSVPEIISRWGYPVEKYNVITDDGYILTMFRIPHGKNASSSRSRQPVFIQHGYKTNSKSFVNQGKKSLGFILADEGYDVWLGNFRGTQYSRNHSALSDSDEEFWNFSFHEIGIYDIRAQVDLVYKFTAQKIIFIGHSLGSTTATIFSSTYPEITEEQPIAQFVTGGEYYTTRVRSGTTAFWKFLCFPYPFQMKMCHIMDMLFVGFDYEQIDPKTLPVTLLAYTETTSIKTVSHITQLMISGKFRRFDHGIENNLKFYGSRDPPEYDLSKMRVPSYLIRSDNDLTSTKDAIEKFNASLPEYLKPYDIYVVRAKNFNHLDFLQAKDVVPLLYNHIVRFISNL